MIVAASALMLASCGNANKSAAAPVEEAPVAETPAAEASVE